jgi:predicted dinucleotide-binding enzyme
LVDATNPLAPGLTGLSVGTSSSGAEQLAALAQGARVVKALNTTSAENMADATYPDGRIFLPVCGDDPGTNAQVVSLATAVKIEAVDVGPLSAACYLEPFAMPWIHMAI